MEQPDRRPIEVEARETLVAAARRFMALHPDVQAVGLTIVSKTIDPKALSTLVVGAHRPIQTPDIWLLGSIRFMEASEYCNQNAKGILLGLDDLANNLARTVEGLRDEQRRLQASAEGAQQPPGAEAEGDHGNH